MAPPTGFSDDRVPELLTIVTREHIGELFDLYFDHSEQNLPSVVATEII